MLVCCKCRREMRCDKNEVGAAFSRSHVYPADRFKCPECGWEALKTNPKPVQDPDRDMQDEYLEMVEGPVETPAGCDKSDIQSKNILVAIKALMHIAGEPLTGDPKASALECLREAEYIAKEALDEMRTNGAPALLRALGLEPPQEG